MVSLNSVISWDGYHMSLPGAEGTLITLGRELEFCRGYLGKLVRFGL